MACALRDGELQLRLPGRGPDGRAGVEINVAGRSYSTQLMQMEETQGMAKMTKNEHGGFLKPQIFSLMIPKVDGGSILSIKVSWFQQLLCIDGQFTLSVPFVFPEYVTAPGKKLRRERIQLNVNTGIEKEVVCKTTSHPLKQIRRQMGKLGFLYERDVYAWSRADFCFSYMISSNDIFGGLLLQSPSMHDFDQREIFCLYLFPGKIQSTKVFRKEVVFLVDISESMRGWPLENAKNALAAALSKLTPADSFSIIAFNEATHLFSSSLVLAKEERVENATKWISENCIARGGTNIHSPLSVAMEMLASSHDSIGQIFLITDGAVEDERSICHYVKTHITSGGSTSPRISTFGIGSYCNHYFLRMLAMIGRGHYDAAYDADSIDFRMQRLFTTASSPILANIAIDIFYHLDACEVYPFPIPDLVSECPLILSGRYQGNFPDSVKAKGVLADMTSMAIDLKLQKAKDIPLDKIFIKRRIDVLTAQAWFTESKELEEKVTKISMQSGVISEYTRMVLLQTVGQKLAFESARKKKAIRLLSKKYADSEDERITLLSSLTPGFGNIIATMENNPTGFVERSVPASIEILNKASDCCTRACYFCCCPCFIHTCSRLNNDCAIVTTQLCSALSCFGLLECCIELCND
ncbi:uncharacterized protein LOC131228171 isoform X2 [Magnolia sinica]|uniref:uncharacterized protein LOC131228171 isoform X2 n=1 Tax=Magnolia sinica TaxID=86752 RepID=UPI00265AC438|nr:uncharacterized protein LOC131228171 isoform X2 [Magnolia sinica]